ncbi:hypothetical protein V1520DRAFT_351088, partial [Lipomyces starkeyi]
MRTRRRLSAFLFSFLHRASLQQFTNKPMNTFILQIKSTPGGMQIPRTSVIFALQPDFCRVEFDCDKLISFRNSSGPHRILENID